MIKVAGLAKSRYTDIMAVVFHARRTWTLKLRLKGQARDQDEKRSGHAVNINWKASVYSC